MTKNRRTGRSQETAEKWKEAEHNHISMSSGVSYQLQGGWKTREKEFAVIPFSFTLCCILMDL